MEGVRKGQLKLCFIALSKASLGPGCQCSPVSAIDRHARMQSGQTPGLSTSKLGENGTRTDVLDQLKIHAKLLQPLARTLINMSEKLLRVSMLVRLTGD